MRKMKPLTEMISGADALAVLEQLRPTATALLDEELRFIQASSGFAEMFGLENGQMAALPLTDLLWEFVGFEEILHAIAEGKEDRLILENINRQSSDGVQRYLTYQVMGVLERETPAALLLIVEDRSDVGRLQQKLITDRNELRLTKQLLTAANAELAHLNQLKSLFFSMAAHDLRTPLSSIQGYAELLRDDLAQDEVEKRDYFDVILSQTYRLQQFINDVMDLDQVERGEIIVHCRDCLLDEIVSEVVAAMRPLADRAGVAIDVDLGEAPIMLLADPRRMAQILYNLLGNGLKFSARGGSVRLKASESADQLVIEIADSGSGISETAVKTLFEPYFPTGGSQERDDRSGSGLGLYIVKLLVEAHAGEITVQSTPGEGTTFSIVLPLRELGESG